ncbi:hypothetical protein BTR23_11935 [Alkalihalophilus pseudofirmus]|nr:hypothetical protein BTR23_11935 [Alkalihalophilus pseudofirmus]
MMDYETLVIAGSFLNLTNKIANVILLIFVFILIFRKKRLRTLGIMFFLIIIAVASKMAEEHIIHILMGY